MQKYSIIQGSERIKKSIKLVSITQTSTASLNMNPSYKNGHRQLLKYDNVLFISILTQSTPVFWISEPCISMLNGSLISIASDRKTHALIHTI